MRFYFRTRHAIPALACVIAVDLALLIAARPLVIYHDSGIVTFTLGTPSQIVVVGILTLSLSSRMEQFEFASIRKLRLLRFSYSLSLLCAGIAGSWLVSMVPSISIPQDLTVGSLAAVRSFIGLFGISLGAVAFADMRLGTLFALPFIFVPAVFDVRTMLGGQIFGFVLADQDATSWFSSVLFFIVGCCLYIFVYSERNSPSPERRAIIDSKLRRKRNVT